MNKKNLSVVMAGAMLATSVAPVLADTTTDNTYEVNSGNVGLLIDRLDTYFEEAPKFDAVAETATELQGKSVYAYIVKNTEGTTVISETTDTESLKALVKNNPGKEYTLEVIDRGHRTDEDGKIVSTKKGTVTYDSQYTIENLIALLDAAKVGNGTTVFTSNSIAMDEKGNELFAWLGGALTGNAVKQIKRIDNNNNSVNIYSGDGGYSVANTKGVELVLADGQTVKLLPGTNTFNFNKVILDGGKVVTANEAKLLSDHKVVAGFQEFTTINDNGDIPSEVLYTVNIVAADEYIEYNVTDLYDGLMFTEKGHDLLHELRDIDAKHEILPDKYSVEILDENNNIIENSFQIVITENGSKKVITVKGTADDAKNPTKGKLATAKEWYKARKANVDILTGSNRYATAVEISKTFIQEQYTPDKSLDNMPEDALDDLKNIVLVNGEALVDGLAAAPYAHALNEGNGAPILLTADNELPKETKSYLKELAANYKLNNLPTIQIVGGEAVVSNAVVEELKDMGFGVKRVAGDNREETSMAVADRIEDLTEEDNFNDKVFVVGADGEADAMSIASYAAATETPIIVSKSAKGLSTVGMTFATQFDNIEIIGGEAAVPKADEEKMIEELSEANVTRIAGDNRFETNAEVIKTYHDNFANVLVAKDGQRNKTELVDALAVSMFASANAKVTAGKTNAAPIVLATNKLSDAQLNEVVKYCDKDTNNKMVGTLYQVGGNTNARPIMQKLAEKLGLTR